MRIAATVDMCQLCGVPEPAYTIAKLKAELAELREALEYLRGECTKVDGDPEDYIEALKKADETLLEDKE